MRHHYDGKFTGTFGECVELAFLPFADLLDMAMAHDLPCEGVWPPQAHYVPRKWTRWLDDYAFNAGGSKKTHEALGKMLCVTESPVLATLMFRVNTAHRIFSVYEEDAKWLQQLRMFMDTHCALVTFVARIEGSITHRITDQDLLAEICSFTNADPLWADLEPNNARIISERLIRYAPSSVFQLNLCYKHPVVKNRNAHLNEILQKCLFHSGALRLLYNMIGQRFADESFYRTLIYIIFCSLLGTYKVAASAPYDVRVQSLIWSTFSSQTRQKLQEFFQAKHAQHLVIYACRQFLDYLGSIYPAFAMIMDKIYMWEHHCVQTRTIMKSIRAYFIEVAPLLEEAKRRSKAEADRVKSEMWTQIALLLKIYHGDHSKDSKVKKQAVTNMKKHLDNLTPELLQIPVKDVDLTLVSRPVWRHACTVASQHPVAEGITVQAIRELKLSNRGFVAVRNVLKVLESGSIASSELLVGIPPIDLEVFVAYITAVKQQFKVRIQLWDSRVAVAQKLAIHRRLEIPEDCPLPPLATEFHFCERCCQFRYTVMSATKATVADTRSSGPKSSTIDVFTGIRFCSVRQRKCHRMLINIEMVGKLLNAQKDFTLCCGCGLPYEFTPDKTFEGFPWCGKCNPDHLKDFDQGIIDRKAERLSKIAFWAKQIVHRAKRKRS